MQSKTTRGVRNLLVSTGVISLVLSVAAPAALADSDKSKDKSEPKNTHADNDGTGTIRMLVCHEGRVHEIDDDAVPAHTGHGDADLGRADAVGAPIEKSDCPTKDDGTEGGDDSVLVCQDGKVTEIPSSDLVEGQVTLDSVDGVDPICDDLEDKDKDKDKVNVCHEGAVLEIAASALDAHVGHGDQRVVDLSTACGPTSELEEEEELEEDGELEEGEQLEDELEEIVDEQLGGVVTTPIVTDPGQSTGAPVVKTPPAAPPAQPLPPAATTRPVVIISTDTVTKPVTPVTPAKPATPAKPQAENEVLGAVTTRTPTPALGALDPGAQTAGTITALAATGSGSTTVLVIVGLVLLLAGFGLQLGARRRVRSSDLAA